MKTGKNVCMCVYGLVFKIRCQKEQTENIVHFMNKQREYFDVDDDDDANDDYKCKLS